MTRDFFAAGPPLPGAASSSSAASSPPATSSMCGVWSAPRHTASAPHGVYGAIALDADMTVDPTWMRGLLQILACCVGAGSFIVWRGG